jgi:hypothetical protein
MANPEHIKILEQGVESWNKWRTENIELADIDLSGANLSEEDLNGINFFGVDLTNTNFNYTFLRGADLSYADLRDATLYGADLYLSNLTGGEFANANFFIAEMGFTIISDADLSAVKGLESIIHVGPSSIGIDTIYKSRGNIPEKFLRGCGVPEDFIVQIPALVAAIQPIQFYSCFISYSSKDEEFAKRLYNDLQSEGVRCWFAPEDLKIGEKLRVRIDEAVRLHDKLLLILSKNSVASQWVEKEVETAFEKEAKQKKTVLFPVRLDDTVMKKKTGWAADVRKSRHIGDFRDWKNHDSYKKAFERLMRDLKAGERR